MPVFWGNAIFRRIIDRIPVELLISVNDGVLTVKDKRPGGMVNFFDC